MSLLYQNLMTTTIEDSINEFCGPYCNPESNQLGFCPTACIPFCYPICNRPFLHVIPQIPENVVIKKVDHHTPSDNQAGNGYPFMFPLFFLAMMLIGFSIFCCYAIAKFAQSCSESRNEAEEEEIGNPVSVLNQELENVVDNPNGLKPSVINSITVFKFKKDGGLIEGTKCSVCLNNFQENETLRMLPECDHAFHVPCIDRWLKSHKNCPICRSDIVSPTRIGFPSLWSEKQSSGGDLEVVKRQESAGTEMEEMEFSKLK